MVLHPLNPSKYVESRNFLSSRPSKNTTSHLLVEGISDELMLVKCPPHRWRISHRSGKKGVIRTLANEISINKKNQEYIGIVDMDGHRPDQRLEKEISKQAREASARDGCKFTEEEMVSRMSNHLNDTRNDVCLIVVLDRLLGGAWKQYFCKEINARGFVIRNDNEWERIFSVAKYRTWLHEGKNIMKLYSPEEYKKEKAYLDNLLNNWNQVVKLPQIDHQEDMGFREWEKRPIKEQKEWGQWNDHILSATIIDYLSYKFNFKSYLTLENVERWLTQSVGRAIDEQKLGLEQILSEVGFE